MARCWPHPLSLPVFFVCFQQFRRSNVASAICRGRKANILAGGSKQRCNSAVAFRGLSPNSCRSIDKTSHLTDLTFPYRDKDSCINQAPWRRKGRDTLAALTGSGFSGECSANTSSCAIDAAGLLVFSEQENFSLLMEKKRTT